MQATSALMRAPRATHTPGPALCAANCRTTANLTPQLRGSTAAVVAGARRSTGSQRRLLCRAELIEVDKDSFYPKAEGWDRLTVLDCYTTWCGPCKMIMPRLVELSDKYKQSVQMCKLNCNQDNKELGKALGVKTVPTFFLFKGNEKLGQVNGAKPDELEKLMVQLLEQEWPELGITTAGLEAEQECALE